MRKKSAVGLALVIEVAWWEKSSAEDDLMQMLKDTLGTIWGFVLMVLGLIKEGMDDIKKDT